LEILDLSNPLDYFLRRGNDHRCRNNRICRRARKLLAEKERSDLISYLAAHPEAGDVMEGTGGVRKVRWAREGKGKSGGVRVIYFYYNEGMPLYLLTLYGKSEKDNLSAAERNDLAKLVHMLLRAAGKR
jgi:hypothetical protein